LDDTPNRHRLAKANRWFSWSGTSCRGCWQPSWGWFLATNRRP